MPKNRNNDTKEFAIGTKIEYNGKLYEVVESVNCGDCSLKNICSNNDVDKPNSDACILRDKRISIFGECSFSTRSDNKSVVFIEIPKDNTNNKYYKIEPLFREDNPSKLKSVKFDLPNGYVIDKYNSDLDKCIIRFKREWLSIEELYDALFKRKEITYRQNLKDFSNTKMLVIANFMDIAKYFNGNWNYKSNGNDCGYIIAYDKTTIEPYGYKIVSINADTDMYFGNITFKNETDARYVIDNPNFRDVLDKIFKV
nr:MAG TPA: hypothetical protein [Crassvirales sp.]